jgi:DNA-binding transcriptional LysR family regulator
VVSDDDRKAIHDGRLVPVLPDWTLPELVISAVTPRRGEQPAKVRHAMVLLADYVAGIADRAQ